MTDAELIEADLKASPLATPGTFEALSRIVARVAVLEAVLVKVERDATDGSDTQCISGATLDLVQHALAQHREGR